MVKKLLSMMFLALALFALPCVHTANMNTPPAVVTTAYASNRFDLFDGVKADGSGDWSVGKKVSDSKALDYGKVFTKYKNLLVFFCGMIICTIFGGMIFRFFKLSMSGSNEMERKKAITGIMVTGIVIAMLGGFSIILANIYGMFR